MIRHLPPPANWRFEGPKAPGLYEIRIQGRGVYIGKCKRPSRPPRHYWRNVRRLVDDLAYRKNNPEGYRRIHRALRDALQDEVEVVITLLEVEHDPIQRARREEALITDRRAEAKRGGLPCLNETSASQKLQK